MIWLLLAASLAASREPPVVLDPRLERFLAAPQLWHRLLQRSASESGSLCRGMGPTRRPRHPSVLVLPTLYVGAVVLSWGLVVALRRVPVIARVL